MRKDFEYYLLIISISMSNVLHSNEYSNGWCGKRQPFHFICCLILSNCFPNGRFLVDAFVFFFLFFLAAVIVVSYQIFVSCVAMIQWLVFSAHVLSDCHGIFSYLENLFFLLKSTTVCFLYGFSTYPFFIIV